MAQFPIAYCHAGRRCPHSKILKPFNANLNPFSYNLFVIVTMMTTLEILDLELTQQKLKFFDTLINSCQKHFVQFLRQLLPINATGLFIKISTVVPH